MSRTLNTMPFEVQKNRREGWRFTGYPAAVGGAWPGRSRHARTRNRSFRLAANMAVRNEQEIPVELKVVKWDVW